MELADVLGSVTATAKTDSLGDRVLVARGSAARQPPETRAAATDPTIVAIVDAVDLPMRGRPPEA